MTLVRSKPSGYGVHDKLTSVEFELVDSQLPRAIDSQGGVYNLTTADLTFASPSKIFHMQMPFLVEGSGALQVENCFTALPGSSLTEFTGDVRMDATLVFGTSIFFSAGAIGFDGPDLVFQNGTFISETTNVIWSKGTMSIDGNVNVSSSSDWAFLGTIYFTQAVDLKAGATNEGIIVNSGAGHIVERYFSMGDADATKGVADCDVVYIPAGTLTTTRNLNLVDATAGARMRIFSLDNAQQVTVKQSGGASLVLVKSNTGFYPWVDIMHTGAANGWFVIGGHAL